MYDHRNCHLEDKKDKNSLGAETVTHWCKDHTVEICSCGWQYGFHGGINQRLIKKEDYENFIKIRCMLCQIYIPPFYWRTEESDRIWQWYKSFGNCCDVCSARASRVLNGTITKDEADELLLKRCKDLEYLG